MNARCTSGLHKIFYTFSPIRRLALFTLYKYNGVIDSLLILNSTARTQNTFTQYKYILVCGNDLHQTDSECMQQ